MLTSFSLSLCISICTAVNVKLQVAGQTAKEYVLPGTCTLSHLVEHEHFVGHITQLSQFVRKRGSEEDVKYTVPGIFFAHDTKPFTKAPDQQIELKEGDQIEALFGVRIKVEAHTESRVQREGGVGMLNADIVFSAEPNKEGSLTDWTFDKLRDHWFFSGNDLSAHDKYEKDMTPPDPKNTYCALFPPPSLRYVRFEHHKKVQAKPDESITETGTKFRMPFRTNHILKGILDYDVSKSEAPQLPMSWFQLLSEWMNYLLVIVGSLVGAMALFGICYVQSVVKAQEKKIKALHKFVENNVPNADLSGMRAAKKSKLTTNSTLRARTPHSMSGGPKTM